ncbi:MAG TPA: hypothetical protein VKR06_07610 [Ktedonosporobacter sp.]|nr:hypothetical protein [Ktedonosporobacter sp.]
MDISQVFGSDGEISDDDLDRLFSELLQQEPPSELVEKILNTVQHLPLPQLIQPEPLQVVTWDEQECEGTELLVHHEHLLPS